MATPLKGLTLNPPEVTDFIGMGDSKHSKLLAPSYVLADLNCLFLDSVASMRQCI
jgi:hypothetical protein